MRDFSTAVADDHKEETIRQDEVSLENEESAAASFLPQTQAHGGKSTQQKPKDAKSHSSQDIDPGLAMLIQKAMAARAMVAEQKDVALSIQAASDSEFEAVFRQENPNDQGFISTDTFRATKQKQGRLNVAAYIRVSTDSTDQEYSYETQERYFNQLIENHPDWNAVGVYSDYGISGTSSDKRTGFKRLMRHCGEGKIDRVVCKSISRFARNTTDFMTALRTLRENNTTILFEKENLDTADPTSEFILTTLGAIAQEESRSISGNITLGNKMRFKRGDVRNEVIYGYRYNGEMVTSASGYQYKDVEIVEEEGSEVEIYRQLSNDIRRRIESLRREKATLEKEQGVLGIMKKNYEFFLACLKELPETNPAGMRLKVNGLDVQGSLFRNADGTAIEGANSSFRKGQWRMTPERLEQSPDLLHFEKGIYCAFIETGLAKGDEIEYKTNFGVTLTSYGNRRTMTSFLGFKKGNLDGTITLVDAPYRVYDNSIQYRRYMKKRAKDRLEAETA